MRCSVLIADCLVYIPACMFFLRTCLRGFSYEKQRRVRVKDVMNGSASC